MSATVARQGGRVQLEQSDMRLALNMAKMAKDGFSRAAIEEKTYLIQKPRDEGQEEEMRGVEFPGHNMLKATIQRNPAMLRQNQTSSCLPCQNGSAKNQQTPWRRKGTGAPPATRLRVRTPEPTPQPTGTPPYTTCNTSGVQPSEILNLPAGYTYSHPALPIAEFFDDDDDTEHDTDLYADMLTDDG